VNDKAAEELELHQETISNDSNSPLHQIRQKELEISGRVLATKRQADEIVAAARREAADIVTAAEAEGGAGAADRDAKIRAEAESEAARLHAEAQAEADTLKIQIDARQQEAVSIVLTAVTTV
jgi:vacuolar-type H+-ATPase subunit H